jgi:predicted DNA-binding ribbon-helix-helix protein
MSISDKNTRTLITLPKELKKQLESIAKNDSRSLNNLVVKILSDFARNAQNDKTTE